MPGVLKRGQCSPNLVPHPGSVSLVNQILGDHNVDKQMTDSRGDVAYLMADISDVNTGEIKDIYEALESLSCKRSPVFDLSHNC